jgi:hypothetical protein
VSRAGVGLSWGVDVMVLVDKADMLSLPYSERVNKRRVKEMVKEFTLLCRGLHGTDYTADY